MKPVHALVAAIMDGAGAPVLLVDGAQSPHTFALKPSAARAIAQADIFIRVSPSLEPFTARVVENLPPTVTLLTLVGAPGIHVIAQRRGGTFEAHDHHDNDMHGDHEQHAGDGDADRAGIDGHIWLDPENAKAIVAEVSKVLADRFPADAERFRTNAAALLTRLASLDGELAQSLLPARGKPFIVFHDAYQYFETRFGVSAAGSVTISPEVQPSAKRLTEVRQKVFALGAVCVFAEPGFQPALVAAVTEGTEAKTGTLDPEGLALQPGPELYFELMYNLARSMLDCFSIGPK